MTNIVKPEYDYDTKEDNDSLYVSFNSNNVTNIFIFYIMAVAAFTVSFFCAVLGFIYSGLFYAALVAFAVFVASVILLRKKKTKKTCIVFSKQFITVDKNRYDLSHVSGIGYDAVANEFDVIPSGRAGGALLSAASVAGYYIYIVYGSKRIKIITGLDKNNIDHIYSYITKFLGRFGYHYSMS